MLMCIPKTVFSDVFVLGLRQSVGGKQDDQLSSEQRKQQTSSRKLHWGHLYSYGDLPLFFLWEVIKGFSRRTTHQEQRKRQRLDVLVSRY